MDSDRRLVFVMTGSLFLLACGADQAAEPAAPAAKINAPVKETDLTTITLTPEAEMRLGVVTVAVERKALPRTRTIGGEVIATPGSESLVTAPLAGTLEAPAGLPAAGSAVAKGRVMFRLVPLAPSERDARVDAERAVAETTARRDVAAKRVQRAEQLASNGAGSRRAAEDAQVELAVADADLKAAQDRLALASRGNAGTAGIELEAPANSLVRNVHASVGQTVAAGAPLFDLVRLDTVWVRVPLYVGESSEIDPQAPARVVGLGDAADAEGLLARPVPAPPSADASTAAVDLYFALSNRPAQGEALRPGQRVGVRLTRRGQTDSLVVPRASLLHDAYGGAWVYEAQANHVYVRRRVAVEDLVDAYVVLSQGPAAGTRVVTDGAAELFGTEFGAGK